MAVDTPNTVVVTEQDGAVDSILTYLKERIESPFLMSFLFSWSVINRDFLFYLFLSNDNNKYERLTRWDFSAFIWNNDWFNWYSPWASSFWYPLLSGVLMALLFSPISMLLSGCRYYLLSKVASFTQSNKSSYDLAHEIRKAQQKLLDIGKQIAAKETVRENVEKDFVSVSEKLGNIKDHFFLANLGSTAQFLVKAAKFDVMYKQGLIPENSGKNSNAFEANSIIEVEITPAVETEKGIFLSNELSVFKGSVFDFFTNETYFRLDSEIGVTAIQKIIERLQVKTMVRLDLNENLRVTISLKKCIVYSL